MKGGRIMTPTIINVLGGAAPKLEVLTNIQSILSMAIIPIYAWFNFNTWAGEKFEVVMNNPPRHFTTFSRYVWYAFLYTMIVEMVYILFLVAPGLIEVVTKAFDLAIKVDATNTGAEGNYPLYLLVTLIVLAPNTPGLRKAERWIRLKLHRQAFIPAEAEALMNQFMMHPARFEPDTKTTERVMAAIGEDIPETRNITRPDKRLGHRWFKMSYLYIQLNGSKEDPKFLQFFDLCGPTPKNCEKEYEKLQLDIRSYYTSKKQIGEHPSQRDKKYLEDKKEDISARLDKLLEKAFRLISCGVLATQKTHHGRIDAFRYFGLNPDFSEGPQIYVDIILTCVFLSTLVTFVATYVFHRIAPEVITNMTTVVSWTVIMIFLMGTSIIGAVFLYRRLSIKRRAGLSAGNSTFVFGPRTDISIGAAAGYLTGFAIIMLYILKFSAGDMNSPVKMALRIWPWPMIPATTAGFIIYYLYSLSIDRKRLAEGSIQGAAMGAVAALAYIISSGLRGVDVHLSFLAYCSMVCCLVGFVIGWTFPEEYRRRRNRDKARNNRRHNPRIALAAEGTMIVGDQKITCQTVNLSMDGAEIAMNCPHEVGTDVLFDIHNVGAIEAVVKRKEGEKTFLQLFPTDEIAGRLASYLGIEGLAPAPNHLKLKKGPEDTSNENMAVDSMFRRKPLTGEYQA